MCYTTHILARNCRELVGNEKVDERGKVQKILGDQACQGQEDNRTKAQMR
jgi:hypothetical protein